MTSISDNLICLRDELNLVFILQPFDLGWLSTLFALYLKKKSVQIAENWHADSYWSTLDLQNFWELGFYWDTI